MPVPFRELAWKFGLSLFLAGLAGLIGFIQWPDPEFGARDGVVVGLLSGVSWAMASFLDSASRWANFFNLFAALLAAMAVGYLAPAKDICRPNGRGWDTTVAFQGACALRASVTGVGPAEMLQ